MMNQVDIEIESVINDLYANNGRKLHQICDKQIIKFGGVSQQDYDDFYSRVGYEIAKAKNTYDPSKGKTFMEYIGKVIKYAVYKEKTDKNRGKRQNFIEYEEKDENGNIIKKMPFCPMICWLAGTDLIRGYGRVPFCQMLGLLMSQSTMRIAVSGMIGSSGILNSCMSGIMNLRMMMVLEQSGNMIVIILMSISAVFL